MKNQYKTSNEMEPEANAFVKWKTSTRWNQHPMCDPDRGPLAVAYLWIPFRSSSSLSHYHSP
mgnify:CR=1 FL=1